MRSGHIRGDAERGRRRLSRVHIREALPVQRQAYSRCGTRKLRGGPDRDQLQEEDRGGDDEQDGARSANNAAYCHGGEDDDNVYNIVAANE